MDVNKKVELLINYRSCSDDTSFDEEYLSTFGGEGIRKSKYILDALSSNQEASKENLSEYIFVSIGGADGSEADEILKKTDIKTSIMVEISDSASAKARERALDLKNTLGKELVIIQGDVTQRLPDVIKCMKKFKKIYGLTGLILSIQAVIHELPRRSPNYRSAVFFGQLFSVFSKNIYFGREPIKPERWPDIVEVKVGNASSENLSKLAEIINDKLSITDLPVTPIANGFINIDSTLAIELLHKLIRPRSVSQFAYELGEQLTSVDPDILKKTIESHLGKATVTIESTITEGFKEAWKLYSVEVKDEQGDPLSYPNTHARLVGFSLTYMHTPSNTKGGYNKSPLRLQKKEIESNKIKIVANRTEIRGLKEVDYESQKEPREETMASEKEERLSKKEESPLSIFLCHSSSDKTKVRELYYQLLAEGFDPWLDEEKLLPGQKWKIEIPKAVRNSDVVIVCLSRNVITKTGYIQKEIKFALDVADEQPEDKIFLIPLKLEEFKVPERLSDWQWVSLFEEHGYEKLMRTLSVVKEV